MLSKHGDFNNHHVLEKIAVYPHLLSQVVSFVVLNKQVREPFWDTRILKASGARSTYLHICTSINLLIKGSLVARLNVHWIFIRILRDQRSLAIPPLRGRSFECPLDIHSDPKGSEITHSSSNSAARTLTIS